MLWRGQCEQRSLNQELYLSVAQLGRLGVLHVAQFAFEEQILTHPQLHFEADTQRNGAKCKSSGQRLAWRKPPPGASLWAQWQHSTACLSILHKAQNNSVQQRGRQPNSSKRLESLFMQSSGHHSPSNTCPATDKVNLSAAPKQHISISAMSD